jgi:hypothetical protein
MFVNPVFLNSLPRTGLSISFFLGGGDDLCFVFPVGGIYTNFEVAIANILQCCGKFLHIWIKECVVVFMNMEHTLNIYRKREILLSMIIIFKRIMYTIDT